MALTFVREEASHLRNFNELYHHEEKSEHKWLALIELMSRPWFFPALGHSRGGVGARCFDLLRTRQHLMGEIRAGSGIHRGNGDADSRPVGSQEKRRTIPICSERF